MAEEIVEKVLEAIEIARATGKLKKGSNEATKALERGTAKLVAVAGDVTPPEVVMHLPLLAKEKNIPCFTVGTKEELGAAAGLSVGTAAVAVIQPGDAKKLVAEIQESIGEPVKEEPAEEKAEEKPAEEEAKEEPAEEKAEEKPAEEEAKEEKAEEAPAEEEKKEE